MSQQLKLSEICAKDIMTAQVAVIDQTMLIGRAAHLMLRERVSSYPVVDQNGVVVGIITINDLFALIDQMFHDKKINFSESIAQFKSRPVNHIMSKNVIGISPDTPLDEIIEIITKWHIHTFPVIKDNKLVGIVGRHDIINATFT